VFAPAARGFRSLCLPHLSGFETRSRPVRERCSADAAVAVPVGSACWVMKPSWPLWLVLLVATRLGGVGPRVWVVGSLDAVRVSPHLM
jgi:hypothetical protein